MFESLWVPRPAEVGIDVCVAEPRGSAAEEELRVAVAGGLAAGVGARRRRLDGPPGPGLAGDLAVLAVVDESDAVLLEAVAAWEKVAAWVVSRQAVVVNELRRRRRAQGRDAFVADEVAARLGVTRAAGERLVGQGLGLEQVPAVWDALDAGRIDARKAGVLCEELLALAPLVRLAVASEVVPLAEHLTVPALRARIRRRALTADPAVAARAHARERAGRFVSLDPVRDGMAWVHAYLPGPDAVAVHTTLTALADAAPPGDGRGMDARRADALVEVVTRWLDAGTTPDGAPLPRRQHRRPHLQVTIAASTLAGADHAPADLAGYGPITAAAARAIAAGTTWQPVGINPTTGEARPLRRQTPAPVGYRPSADLVTTVLTRDATCTFPGCRTPAHRCDIDHIDPYDPTRPAHEQTTEDNLHALCRHHHNLKTHAGWAVHRDPTTGTTTWTAPTGHHYHRPPTTPPGPDHPPQPDHPPRQPADDDPGPPPF